MPIFEEQREAKIHDMEQSSSDVLQYMNSPLSSYPQDEQMVVGMKGRIQNRKGYSPVSKLGFH